MSYEHSEFLADMLRKLAKLDYIRPNEIPNIDLYMDQVTTFMDSHLEATKRSEADKILTKTMINNYAKNNLLPPPVKKKYSRDHMITLMFIYYFKSLMSISDIQSVLGPLTERFFAGNGSVSLEHIYKEIYQGERERLPLITKDIISMFKKAEGSFENVSNEEEKEYLQIFSFICYLCFDMYMKKEMVENIIDELNSKRASDKTADSKAARTDKSVKPNKPIKSDKPVKPDKPVKSDKPTGKASDSTNK